MAGREIPLPGMGDDRAGYSGPVAARAAGVSYRQIDHWTTKELVRASVQDADGPGSSRQYADEDVVRVALIGELRRVGLPLGQIGGLLGALDSRGQPLGSGTLVWHGEAVAVVEPSEGLDLVASGRAAVVVALGPLRSRVLTALEGHGPG